MANQPAPPKVPPKRNKGLIASLIKGNQWLIGPDHKALFLGGVRDRAGWLICPVHILYKQLLGLDTCGRSQACLDDPWT